MCEKFFSGKKTSGKHIESNMIKLTDDMNQIHVSRNMLHVHLIK